MQNTITVRKGMPVVGSSEICVFLGKICVISGRRVSPFLFYSFLYTVIVHYHSYGDYTIGVGNALLTLVESSIILSNRQLFLQ